MFVDMDQSIPRFYCLFPTIPSKVGIGTEEALIKLLKWNNCKCFQVGFLGSTFCWSKNVLDRAAEVTFT